MEDKRRLVAEFERREKDSRRNPEWIRKFRRDSLEKFLSLPFPTTRQEEWRFTNVAPITKTPFHFPAHSNPEPASLPVDPFAPGDEIRLVFIDGRYSAALSTTPEDKIHVGSLAQAVLSSAILEDNLGRQANSEENAFVAMNSAFFEDGALVEISPHLILSSPLHLLFVSTAEADSLVQPRVFIFAGKGSEATVLEEHISLGSSRYFSNAVTEIVAGEGSVLHHLKIQHENEQSFHLSSVHASQQRDSSYSSFLVTLGSELSRTDLNVRLDGVGADCSLNGLYLVSGNQHTDHHTTIDHVSPHGTSHELYKGILSGNSRAVFNGKIIVRKDAQKTDARQTNKNLLLSDRARINTKPQLEILADDVKCNHGATIGHLEEEALFYLKSRGVSDPSARAMLMYGFVHDVSDRIKSETVRTRVEALLKQRLLEFSEAA